MRQALLPDQEEVTLESLTTTASSGVLMMLRASRPGVACPSCGTVSRRVHSRYLRAIADLPWEGVSVMIRLRTRRFFCTDDGCPKRIFVEPLPQTVSRYGRRTCRSRQALDSIAMALGGAAGARLARQLGLLVHRLEVMYCVGDSLAMESPSMKQCLMNTACVICLLWSVMSTSAQGQLDPLLLITPAPHEHALPFFKGKPCTFTETDTTVKKQGTGPPQTTVFVRRYMRDSEGRLRSEWFVMEDGKLKWISTTLTDPVGHFMALLLPDQKLAVMTHFPAPEAQGKLDAQDSGQDAASRSASSDSNEQDLPAETIAGVSAPGHRFLWVQQGISVIYDSWFSVELNISLKQETNDPQKGHFSAIVSDLQRTEPSPSLFEIPKDYRVESPD